MTSKLRTKSSLLELYLLFLKPSRFFTQVAPLGKKPAIWLVAWCAGISFAIGRVNTNMIKGDFSLASSGWKTIEPWLTRWPQLWVFLLVFGLVNGVFFWYAGGWWYRKRLEWCGARDVDARRARVVYVYQDLVYSGPVVLVLLAQTALYANYAEAWRADEWWSSLVAIFLFWSCATSYRAAVSAFAGVSTRKAKLWFLVAPIILYVLGLGMIGVASFLRE